MRWGLEHIVTKEMERTLRKRAAGSQTQHDKLSQWKALRYNQPPVKMNIEMKEWIQSRKPTYTRTCIQISIWKKIWCSNNKDFQVKMADSSDGVLALCPGVWKLIALIERWGSHVKDMQITPSHGSSVCDPYDFCANCGASSLVSARAKVLPLSTTQGHPGSWRWSVLSLRWRSLGKSGHIQAWEKVMQQSWLTLWLHSCCS